jgi:hypothetical protein
VVWLFQSYATKPGVRRATRAGQRPRTTATPVKEKNPASGCIFTTQDSMTLILPSSPSQIVLYRIQTILKIGTAMPMPDIIRLDTPTRQATSQVQRANMDTHLVSFSLVDQI